MDVKLVKKDSFRIIGVTEDITQDMEQNFKIIPKMWEKATKNGTLEKLCSHMNSEPKAILGLSIYDDSNKWKYAIAVASEDATEETFSEFIIPSATWAVFKGEGKNIDIQILTKRILTEWFPTSGYEFGKAPEIEVYYSPDPNNAIFEIWVPVVSKND